MLRKTCVLQQVAASNPTWRPYGSSFPGSFTNTDHGYAVLPHYAADVREVEADQPVDHQQIRDGADGKAGPLLGVTGIAGGGLLGLLTDIESISDGRGESV